MNKIMNDVTPPTTILVSFAGFLLSALSVLGTAALAIAARDQVVDAVRGGDQGPQMSEEMLQRTTTFSLAVVVAIAALIGLVYLWLAFKLKAGRNWARVALTVITAIEVVTLFTTEGGTWLGYVSCAVAVAALVFSYLPASSAYIARVRTAG